MNSPGHSVTIPATSARAGAVYCLRFLDSPGSRRRNGRIPVAKASRASQVASLALPDVIAGMGLGCSALLPLMRQKRDLVIAQQYHGALYDNSRPTPLV